MRNYDGIERKRNNKMREKLRYWQKSVSGKEKKNKEMRQVRFWRKLNNTRKKETI